MKDYFFAASEKEVTTCFVGLKQILPLCQNVHWAGKKGVDIDDFEISYAERLMQWKPRQTSQRNVTEIGLANGLRT